MSGGFAYCTDPNPWDASLRCELPANHRGLHQAEFSIRWDDGCHFPGDDCQPAHLEETA